MSRAELVELRRIRAALERPRVEPVFVDYATAAQMLCLSKRSVERLVAEKRLRVYDIAGPKLRVADLRAMGDKQGRAPKARAPRAAADSRRARELVASAAESQGETPDA